MVSKIDLGVADGAAEALDEMSKGETRVDLSILKGTGVAELETSVTRVLGEVRVVLDAMVAVEEEEKEKTE